MANKTTWKTGQSGNPGGRPPKSRALTEILIAAGNEKAISAAGGHVARKKLIATMIWQLLVSGQLTFLKANRDQDVGAYHAVDKVREIDARDWFEVVKWLFAQCDGDLTIQIKDDESEGETPGGAGNFGAPQLYLPDNGRETKKEDGEAAK